MITTELLIFGIAWIATFAHLLFLVGIRVAAHNVLASYSQIQFPLYLNAIEITSQLLRRFRLSLRVKQLDDVLVPEYFAAENELLVPKKQVYNYDYYTLLTVLEALLVAQAELTDANRSFLLVRVSKKLLAALGILVPLSLLIGGLSNYFLVPSVLAFVALGLSFVLWSLGNASKAAKQQKLTAELAAEYKLIPEEIAEFKNLFMWQRLQEFTAGLGFYRWLIYFFSPRPTPSQN